MSVFEDMRLTWEGRTYDLPSDKIFPVLARMEEILTIQELARMVESGAIRLTLVSKAYGIVLRAAGADITDEEIYAGMFGSANSSGGDVQVQALSAIQFLMSMMVPPQSVQNLIGIQVKLSSNSGGTDSGKKSNSSKKPTELPLSGQNGSLGTSSGSSIQQNTGGMLRKRPLHSKSAT